MSLTPLRSRLGCEALEARENPAPLLTESFDGVRAPDVPPGWSSWGTGAYITSQIGAVSGTNSLGSTGNAAAESRYFSNVAQPADAAVSAKVLSDSPTPVVVLARGQNLTTFNGSYVGVRVGTSGTRVELIDLRGDATAVLATLQTESPVYGTWLTVTLKPVGAAVSASVQRADTGQFLSAAGAWQTADADALTAQVAPFAGNGFVGVGRAPGGAGIAFFDDLRVDPPAVAPPIRENFDTTASGRPTNWRGWTGDGTAGFGVSGLRFQSAPQGFTAGGGTNTAARSWLAAAQPADVQVSASLYADSLVPGTVLLRGGRLDAARPNYYGLTVTRGLEAKLVRVIDGVETTLATLRSRDYLSGVWLRLTLTASGDRLRAVVTRQDTGAWLTPDGTWADSPQPALEVTDGALAAGGFVGLQRGARTSGPVTFDNFEIRPAAQLTGPRLTLTASQPGPTFTGEVTFQANDPDGTTRRVEFRVDGKLRAVSLATPASYTLDTTQLANAGHELIVRAVDDLGNPTSATIRFTSANADAQPLPARPALPRKLSHIRIAQLAYSGTPFDAFTTQRIRDGVDLVIPNIRFLGAIDAASPGTPQVIYSNISNLYQGLLTNWLSYADATGASREAAFYHVTRATPFTGSSPSSQPVTWLWGVWRGAADGTGTMTDLTGAAHGGRSFAVDFGAAGSALTLGYLDRFAELNFDISRAAAPGWQGVWEYPTAVDGGGKPTAWKSLALTGDGTQSFAATGRVAFEPPADWVTARVGSGEPLYHVRVRTVSGTVAQAPVARTVLGRDYVNAGGRTQGTIPAFDAAADRDGDGYLSDAEYATRAPGKDARFVSESRLLYPYYGQMRFVTNPSSSAVRHWAEAYHLQQLRDNPLADGIFLDNSGGRLPFAESVVEPTANYAEDYAAVVAGVWKKVAPKIVIANTSGGNADATPVAAASTGVLEEFVLRPTEANWASFTDVAAVVASRLAADNPSPYTILDSHPGGFAVTGERAKIGTLAYYYLLADPDKTMLMFFGGYSPSAPWRDTWITAAATDVGQPGSPYTTFATGQDPENAALGYRVYRRDYGKAVVLYKPRSYALGRGTGTAGDATATTHDLNGNYRALHADGTLGPVVRGVTLRNGEGAVMLKA